MSQPTKRNSVPHGRADWQRSGAGGPPRQDRPSTASLLDTPAGRSTRLPWIAALAAGVVHALILAGALRAGTWARPASAVRAAQITELFEVQQEPPPPPPPPPPSEPTPAPPPKAASKPPRIPKPPPTPEEAAPAAAEAAKVVAQEPTPEVVDFGDTFVQGQSASYAGGVTEAGGTAQHAVRESGARAFGVEGGKGTAAVDRSREPTLAEGGQWDCPFPEEADSEGVDTALVTLQVRIAANGSVEQVEVAKDPGFGFGREARRCALRKRWQAGRDRAGQAIAASRLLSVRFRR